MKHFRMRALLPQHVLTKTCSCYVRCGSRRLVIQSPLSLTAAEITRCKTQTAEFIKDSKRPGDRTGRNGCHSFPGKKFLPRFVCVEGNREGGMCLSSCKEKKKTGKCTCVFLKSNCWHRSPPSLSCHEENRPAQVCGPRGFMFR